MSSTRKIVIMASVVLEQSNAPSLHLISLANELAAKGNDIVLVVPHFTGDPPLPLTTHNVHLDLTPQLRRFGLPNSVNPLAQLAALLRHRHHGTLYLRTSPLSLILTIAARILGYRAIVLESNGWIADELRSLGVLALFARFFDWIQASEARRADALRVVTKGLAEIVNQVGVKAPVAVIGNGTNLDLYRPIDRKACRDALGLSDECDALVFSGSLTPWQDIETLFAATDRLRRKGRDVVLFVVGDSGNLEHYRKRAAAMCGPDTVRFLGALPPVAVNRVLNAADVGIAPFTLARNARIGLSPLKIRDYTAAGLPVISNDLPGIVDFAKEDWILLVPCEDVAALASAIEMELDRPRESRTARRFAARAFAERHFDWSLVVAEIEKLIATASA